MGEKGEVCVFSRPLEALLLLSRLSVCSYLTNNFFQVCFLSPHTPHDLWGVTGAWSQIITKAKLKQNDFG